MDSSRFHQHFGDDANFWGEDEDHPLSMWQELVSADDTRLGYWDWVKLRREEAEEESGQDD